MNDDWTWHQYSDLPEAFQEVVEFARLAAQLRGKLAYRRRLIAALEGE
jgi:hypothetical protein